MKICIPSHQRSATISTIRLVPDATVCVPESQVADYRAAGCHDVVTHPDSIRGLTPKLNWMLDRLADDEGIIFLDGDLEYLCRCFVERSENSERKVTEAAIITQVLKETAAQDTRYAFCQRATFTGGGGQSFFRNSETESRDIAILRRKYGDLIQVGKQGGTRRRDYAGVQKVTLKLPF